MTKHLTHEEREQLLPLIAEGLTVQEIQDALQQTNPALLKRYKNFKQQVGMWRRKYEVDIAEIAQENDLAALHTGLAIRAKRVEALKRLAAELEEDLFEKKLRWVKDVKGIGSGENFELVNFETFNEAEIRQLRGVYDDIAKETGGRVRRADVTSNGKSLKGYVIISPDDWDEDTPLSPN